jgi:hypothetical protein
MVTIRFRLLPLGLPRKYCDLWAVSRKRIGKHVATERLILGNQVVTEHGFHGYENGKLWTLRNGTVASELHPVSETTHSWRAAREPLEVVVSVRFSRIYKNGVQSWTREVAGRLQTSLSCVEAGSNTSTVTLRVVGGDEREVSNQRQ